MFASPRLLLISAFVSLSIAGCCSWPGLRAGADAPVIRGQDESNFDPNALNHTETGRPPAAAGTPTPEPVVYLPISLREAMEAALADSSVVRVLDGGVNVALITPTDVLMAEERIEVERGRFQPRLGASLDGSRIDQPPGAFFGPGIALNNQRDTFSTYARVTQPLTSGGTASLGFEPPLSYLFLPNGVSAGHFNPLYSSDYVFRVNQPVLQGAGRDIALAPIQIAQTQASQSRWQLEETLNSQIRSVTEAYWRLYDAHLELEAVKTILPLAEESVRIEELRRKADRSILADVARAQFQLDGFRRTRSVMQGVLRKRVLYLRQLIGGEATVQPLFLPSERPAEDPPPEDLPTLVQVAVQNRPTLNELRDRLNEKQISLRVANNQVLPSVNLRGEYRMSGLSQRLDTSIRQANTSDYTDWTLGVLMDVPIGNKTALSKRQIAELDMARVHIRLNALEQNVAFEITELVSDLQAQWQRLEIAKRQALETQEWLRVSRIRYTQPQAASISQDWLLLALTDLQSAMRAYVDAVSEVGSALADYNTLLARLNQAQGISVYQWRQKDSQETYGGTPGGHAGFAYQDYRENPEQVLQTFHAARDASREADIPRLPNGMPAPGENLSFGHTFLNPPQPLLPMPAPASTLPDNGMSGDPSGGI